MPLQLLIATADKFDILHTLIAGKLRKAAPVWASSGELPHLHDSGHAADAPRVFGLPYRDLSLRSCVHA